jgi:hypothetical protein
MLGDATYASSSRPVTATLSAAFRSVCDTQV